MISRGEVQETNNMISEANLDVRTITMGINLLDCVDSDQKKLNEKIYDKVTKSAEKLVSTGDEIGKEFGVPIVNKRISVTQRQSVLDALTLRDAGRNATQIKQVLEEQKLDSSIYITLETLKYLKKGGRITPAAAAIGTVLNLKPVLQIQGEKLDAYSKTRGKKQAKRVMLKAMQNDWENRFAEYVKRGEMCLQSAYTGNQEEAEEFKKEIAEVFPEIEIVQNPLSLSVACHIGHGAIAVACSRKVVVE